ncbi:MAG: protein translocase SEC61 complex subunit gamma [Nanoarchaeota archaeon]|nr:protein translocase SEC61 complex subunit gamma [Nanoarchaeota archaeon]
MNKRSWFKKKKKEKEKRETTIIQETAKKQRKPFFKFKKRQPGEPGKIKKTISQWKRTLEVARKPGKEEYLASAKITGIGIALLGFIGFIIFMLFQLVK